MGYPHCRDDTNCSADDSYREAFCARCDSERRTENDQQKAENNTRWIMSSKVDQSLTSYGHDTAEETREDWEYEHNDERCRSAAVSNAPMCAGCPRESDEPSNHDTESDEQPIATSQCTSLVSVTPT